jgi:hypothetical protein
MRLHVALCKALHALGRAEEALRTVDDLETFSSAAPKGDEYIVHVEHVDLAVNRQAFGKLICCRLSETCATRSHQHYIKNVLVVSWI